MILEQYGYNETLEIAGKEAQLDGFLIGRVISEHKERYRVITEDGEINAEITGNLRFSAEGREDFPAVGDWVALISYDPELAIIHKILPRHSIISRQAVASHGEIQIIATNIDHALLVQACDRDFNVNRLERYLTICYSAKVDPIIVLTKTDLINNNELSDLISSISKRIDDVPIVAISNIDRSGFEELDKYFKPVKTYCMLGSSGVGKSSLLNSLTGSDKMRTDSISDSTNKGRHITSHRELVLLENGSILIDNPGMREVGISDTGDGLDTSFDKILVLSEGCKYSNCTHTNEIGCAVIQALENGELDDSSYKNYLKIEKEKAYFESTREDRKQKDKQLGKILKDYKKKNIKGKK